MRLLPGSTATVTAPGRADRTLGLAGGLRGFIPGRFVLNVDYPMNFDSPDPETQVPFTNAVGVSSLVSDPLCAAAPIHPFAPFADGSGSALSFKRTGAVSGKLVFSADPTTFAGCSGPESGTTTINLEGKLGVKKLADLTLTGTLADVPVGGGVNGTVTVSLEVKIDILDN